MQISQLFTKYSYDIDNGDGVAWSGDFTKDGRTLEDFVAPFFPVAEAKRIRDDGLKIKFTEYDWALNEK